jgi:PAS domain S-box-containing protein
VAARRSRSKPDPRTRPKVRRRPQASARMWDAKRTDLVLRAINEGVYDWDIASDTVYYSDWVRRALGLRPEELKTPADWRNRIHPEDLPRYDAALVAHFKGRSERFDCEFRYRGGDGDWHWARQHGFCLRDRRGRAVRMIGATGDITELKQATEALRASEERYALAMRAATEGVYEWDVTGDALYITDTTKVFFWSTDAALTPRSWNERIHPQDFEGYRRAIGDHFKGRTPHLEHEYRVRDASGSYLWVLDRGIGVRGADGRVVKMVGAVSDITPRKRAEEAARRAHAETMQALEQQTAIAEILRVISNSPTDIGPVLDAVAENAARLCEAWDAVIRRIDGDGLRAVAHVGAVPVSVEVYPITRGSVGGRAVIERRTIHVQDMLAADSREEYPEAPGLLHHIAYRTMLAVPLLREGAAVGVILIRRMEVQPFSDKQIELLETFARQAVIAIENVRLFNETKEALERQTATSEVLRVIASSPSDIQPVFDAIAHSANRLLGGHSTAVARLIDDSFHLVGFTTTSAEGDAALKRGFPIRAAGTGVLDALLRQRAPVRVVDTETAPDFSHDFRALARARGFRSMLLVPLLREGAVIGWISVTRRNPGEFQEHDVELLRTFADQAAIAIENVRLFKEIQARNRDLGEALEQQKAFAEILRVISGSVANTTPVFEAIVDACERLFPGHGIGINLLDENGAVYLRASRPSHGEGIAALRRYFAELASRREGRQVKLRRSVAHYPDVENDPGVPEEIRAGCRATGQIGAIVYAPLVMGGRGIGSLWVSRPAVGAFAENDVALLKTFADQAVIALENARLFNETKEALERQTATAEILEVMSRSQTDVQPVFDTIAANAVRLSDAQCAVFRYDGELVHVVALGNVTPEAEAAIRRAYPQAPSGGAATTRAIRDRAIVHIPDVRNDPGYAMGGLAQSVNYRSILCVPMLRAGEPVGAITVTRVQPNGFPEPQVAMLKAFADQAVIAIENVRLFNETREALERQTATAEILKVISESPTDVQPVFDAIVQSAARLFACRAGISIIEGGSIDLKAIANQGMPANVRDATFEAMKKFYPLPFDPERSPMWRAVANREIVEMDDTEAPGVPERVRELGRAGGYRSATLVPLARESACIGTIGLAFEKPGVRLDDKQRALIKTFADQAVIAIENVRLFNETTEALERQTATAEILKVISESPTDTQPVFDAIAASARKLFGDAEVGITLIRGDAIELVAAAGLSEKRLGALRASFPRPLDLVSTVNTTVVDGRLIHYPDTLAEDVPAYTRDTVKSVGIRAMLGVPLLREGRSIGGVLLSRATPGAYTEQQIALLQTFADQAVIAIENVRLLRELQERTEALTKSVGQLTALGEVSQAISSTLQMETVLRTVVSRAVQLTGLDAGVIYEYDQPADRFELRASQNFDEEGVARLRAAALRSGEGAVGTAVQRREPVQVHDTHAPDYPARLRGLLDRYGYRALLAVPLLREDNVIGALLMGRRAPGAFPREMVELLQTFASQSTLAIQNARLFREIEAKSRQLEVASQHKSQFLASMSHELRTPLNAILGFNEMVLDGMYGELSEELRPPLENMQTSGKHLLRLINNVLDLAKIEAGRMELALADYSVQDTVASVHSTLRPLAAEKGLEFVADASPEIPLAYGDGGRITQCLMNLAGNSLKFTKAGKVEIGVEQRDGLLRYHVADTGIGIPADKIGSLFTEFKQTDATIASEYGGTGLGLSITKKFIEMHGGRIWVESEAGRGSTFIFEVPLRAAA